VIICCLAGAATEVFSIGWVVAMQEHVEEDMLSRAFSYDALGNSSPSPSDNWPSAGSRSPSTTDACSS
jgi:hypothetical protein